MSTIRVDESPDNRFISRKVSCYTPDDTQGVQSTNSVIPVKAKHLTTKMSPVGV